MSNNQPTTTGEEKELTLASVLKILDAVAGIVEEVNPNASIPEGVLDNEIGWLDLSVRAFNCLARAQLRTVRDIVSLEATQILQIKNIGDKTISEVADCLKKRGIVGTAWEF